MKRKIEKKKKKEEKEISTGSPFPKYHTTWFTYSQLHNLTLLYIYIDHLTQRPLAYITRDQRSIAIERLQCHKCTARVSHVICVYIYVYISLCVLYIICVRTYVCKYSVNVQSTCVCDTQMHAYLCQLIQVIRTPLSNHSPPPPLSLSLRPIKCILSLCL